MPNIIRIRNLQNEQDLNGVIFPVDKGSYYDNAKQINIADLKAYILSGFTGGGVTGGTSGTSGIDGIDGIDGTNGTRGTSGTSGSSGSSGTNGTSGTRGTSGTSGSNGTSGSSGITPCLILQSNTIRVLNGPPTTTTTTSTTRPITTTTTTRPITTTTTTRPITTTTTTRAITTTTTTIGGSPCGGSVSYNGGLSYPSTGVTSLGSGLGTVTLTFDALSIPDQFIVIFDGNIVINTGYRGASQYDFGGSSRTQFKNSLTGKVDPVNGGTYPNLTNFPNDGYPRVTTAGSGSAGSGTQSFVKSTSTTTAFVRVYAPMTSTIWNYTLACPV